MNQHHPPPVLRSPCEGGSSTSEPAHPLGGLEMRAGAGGEELGGVGGAVRGDEDTDPGGVPVLAEVEVVARRGGPGADEAAGHVRGIRPTGDVLGKREHAVLSLGLENPFLKAVVRDDRRTELELARIHGHEFAVLPGHLVETRMTRHRVLADRAPITVDLCSSSTLA